MKAIDPSYQPPEQTYETFPDGKYKVKGFEWFTKDEQDRPILVAQKDGKLVGRLKFNLLDDEEGPPMSCTLTEMVLLAKAMKVSKALSVPDEAYAAMVTKFMIEVRNLCADKELEVEVARGWVNSIPGMDVPEGYFYFYVSDVSSPAQNEKGEPKPKEGQFGSFFFVTFTVESGEGGKETPYKGAKFTELVNYSVVVEDNVADFEKNKDGSYTAAAVRLSKLMRLAAPDPFAGDFTPSNPHNLLPLFKQKAVEQVVMLKGTRAKEEKGNRIRLVWATLEEASGYEGGPKRLIDEMDINTKIRYVLVDALEKLSEGKPVVVSGSLDFTDVGKMIAKEYLSPIRKEGLIKHGSLEELEPEEVTTILTHLQDKVGSSYKEKVVMLSVGFEPPLEEIDDSPF